MLKNKFSKPQTTNSDKNLDFVIEEEEEVRLPIDIKITDMKPNGELTLYYSEELHSLEKFKDSGLDLEMLNSIRDLTIELEYHSNAEEIPDEKVPVIKDFKILAFEKYSLSLSVKFLNPLYVSAFKEKDSIRVKFVQNMFFIATKDSLTLEANYTTKSFVVPTQAKSQEEYETLSEIGS